MNLDVILQAYKVCALWSSTDADGEPLDAAYDTDDIAPETQDAMLEDVTGFVDANRELLVTSALSDEQIGHDFWLTRNGHGAGFWDRGLSEVGEKLTQAAKVYGSVDLYVGDDGKVYQ